MPRQRISNIYIDLYVSYQSANWLQSPCCVFGQYSLSTAKLVLVQSRMTCPHMTEIMNSNAIAPNV